MSQRPTRYREIEVSGPPRELGRQLGEAARDEVRGFVEIALERVNLTMPVSRENALAVARKSAEFVEGYSPHLLAELSGVAEAAGVSLDDLMLLQVRNQLRPDADAGCTSLSVAADTMETGQAVVGQNWDADPALDEFTLVLTRRPQGKPANLTLTQAGLIAYIGLSEAGLGFCLNTLPADSRPLGVPHYFTLRMAYEAASLDEAVESIRRADRAHPANIMTTTPQGPADLEVTLDEVRVLTDESGQGYITHTNHCLHADLCEVNERFPELIESGPRKRRIDELLGELPRPFTLAGLQQALSDHQGHPKSICRHPNDHPQHGFWETVFSVLIEPTAGTLHATRGTPCSQPYETYRLK